VAPLLPLILLGGAIVLSKTNRPKQNVASKGGQTIPVGKDTSGFGNISKQEMQLIQYDLGWLGYLVGPFHGQYDADTAAAIESFQDDHGLHPVDGLPGTGTLEALEQVMSTQP